MSDLNLLKTQIAQAMPADRQRLENRLRNLEKAQRAGKPFDRNLAQLTADLEKSLATRAAKQARRPQIVFDPQLPIAAKREEIAAAIAEHQVIIVCGETGSGKSTQLPKICLEMGRGLTGLIGHTQPRRIAARSVAARIAEELGSPLGRDVGFKIRFTDATSPQTFIKLMTDGILLAESQHDRALNQYDTIIIDEAHERSLNIDFLLGYLHRLLPRRRDLRLIITSATIDAERFSQHFGHAGGPAPVIEVSGRTYPVDVWYRPPVVEDDEPDWQQGVLDAVDELARVDRGDMLIFMPTERDILSMAKLLRGHAIPGDDGGRKTEIVPLYARLTAGEQNRVFQSHTGRRIVIATNVAESSLTVPGIRYVIDPGTARISRYSPRSKVQRLPIEPVSQASADQRKGRCGRVGPGICVRLFSEEDYLSRDRFTAPEIQRSNLASVILQIKALRLGEIQDFPFIDPPKREAVRDGYKTLLELRAIDETNELTDLGRRLSRMPTDPRIARIVLAGHEENCLEEILIIAAALETQDPRERPLEKQEAADTAHAQFADEQSDFLGYLKLWDFYQHVKQSLSQNQLRKACRQNFLSYNRLREWVDIHRQLVEMVAQEGFKPGPRRSDYNAIHRALLSGFLSSVGFRADTSEYTVAGGNKAFLWPGSGLVANKPKWVMGGELVETNRRYLRTAARIDPAWIEPLGAHLLSRSYADVYFDAKGGSAMAFERVSLFGLVIVPRRRVRYGPINPTVSRELFIQHGLVEEQWDTRAGFFTHNRQLREEAERLEHKTRRRDLLLGDFARYEFYDRRIPADVFDAASFERWRRAAEQQNRQLLFMSSGDVLREQAAEPPAASFPDSVSMRGLQLPLAYHFEPAASNDGVTVTVPQEAIAQVDYERLGWIVPGLLEEKIVALVRSLPKAVRRKLIPAPDTAKKVLAELSYGEGHFPSALARLLSRYAGEPVRPGDFQTAEVPGHLQMNLRVVDAAGNLIVEGRDVEQLRRDLHDQTAAELESIDDSAWRRDGIVAWDFGELPAAIEIERSAAVLTAYPALVDRGESVGLRLASSPETARAQTRGGMRRLFVLAASRQLKSQVDWLPNLDKATVYASGILSAADFRRQLVDLIAERALFEEDDSDTAATFPRDAATFQHWVKSGVARIGPAVQEIAVLIGPMMEAYHQVRFALEEARAPQWRYAVDDLREQLEHLLPKDFLTATPRSWLAHFPRYLRAAKQRLEKLGAGGLARDQANYEQICPRWQAYLDCAESLREQGATDPQLERYRWMLEEFRVSLFAQKLGTSQPISEKRLDQQWSLVGCGQGPVSGV